MISRSFAYTRERIQFHVRRARGPRPVCVPGGRLAEISRLLETSAFLPRRHTYNLLTGRNVPNDAGSRTDYHIVAQCHAWNDGGSRAYKTAVTDGDIPRKGTTWCNMDCAADLAVVVHACIGVDDG